MGRLRRELLRAGLLVAVAVPVALGLTGGSASAHATSSLCCAAIEHWNGTSWKPVPAPDLGSNSSGGLLGVAAISRRNIWAVGANGRMPLVEHWNGSTWARVSLPYPSNYARRLGTYGGSLRAVSETSASDVWAVGSWNSRTLIEHWNGKKWTQIPSPNATDVPAGLEPYFGSYLLGVKAISPTNAWAVGEVSCWGSSAFCPSTAPSPETAPPLPPLVLHWDGKSWKFARPGLLKKFDWDYNSWLSAVDATSAGDLWTVGVEGLPSSSTLSTLIARRNGTGWNSVYAGTAKGAGFHGVTALSPTQAWAVGEQGNGQMNGADPFAQRWNGHGWKTVAVPGVFASGAYTDQWLNAAAAVSATNVWAVGGAYHQDGPGLVGVSKTLIEHWNGHAWTPVPVADPTPVSSLNGIAAVSATNVWAVGSY